MLVTLNDQHRRVKAATTGGQPNTTKVAPGFALSPSYFANRIRQFRQVSLNGSPDDFEIDLEVTMRDAVAHGVDNRPGNFGMLGGKVRGSALDVSCGFPDDLNVAQDRIPDHLVAEEADFVDILGVLANALDGFEDVAELIGDTQLLAGHTGMASAMT